MSKENKEEKFVDATTEFHILKKNKKNKTEIDDEDFSALEATREFKKLDTTGDIVVRFKPKPNKGLTFSQVEQRRKEGLVNKPKRRYDKSVLQIIFKNLFTFLNLLLFLAFALLLIAQSSKISNYFFMLIILSNLFIGIFQEIKAKKIIDKLSLVAKAKSIVIREGIKTDLYPEELVLDDIVLLSAGQKIVSDSVVKEGMVEVNESLLTGESLPVKKNPGDLLFAGSFVSSGSCVCQIERVGSENYITQLQERAKKEKKNNSIILKSLNWIIGIIALLVIPLGAYNFFSRWLISGAEWHVALETAASSMVAMIPSGLYLTTSVALVVSVIKLATRKTLVQDNYSIEMLARTDVLCLDKTGTITDGTMEVYDEVELNKETINPNDIIGDLLDSFEEKNQTATALLNSHPSKGTYRAIIKLPFSSSRKMSAVTFENIGTYVVGAPEFMLDKDDAVIKKLSKFTEQGYRVLLLAKASGIEEEKIVGKIIPLHAYIIKDHIRPEAHDTLKWFADNGVDIKIISGDNVLTVAEIARQAGVENSDKYISLEGLSLEEVAKAANEYTIFGRVAPEQKATLVTALKKAGHTVAMTGDGVNDILALKKADCSIAMASGSEAARNVSSLVLLESNFACLPKVVEEGRRVINNITAVASLFLMKTLFAIVVTVSTKYVFQPANLLVLEIFGIGLPSFFLALQANNKKIQGGFIKNVLSKSIPGGLIYSIGAIIITLIMEHGIFNLSAGPKNVYIQTIAGLYISIMGFVTLYNSCIPFSNGKDIKEGNKIKNWFKKLNGLRVATFGGCLVVGLGICFLPYFEKITGYQIYELPFSAWILLLVSVIIGAGLFIGLVILFNHLQKKKAQKDE